MQETNFYNGKIWAKLFFIDKFFEQRNFICFYIN
jgi:hypothetical protein